MNFRWEEYLTLAKELSTRKSEAAARASISRAYYAAFHAAKDHRGAAGAHATSEGSHRSIWRALKDSGNPNWRRAGNQGRVLHRWRVEADYQDSVPELSHKMKETIRMAEEILNALRP